MPKRIPRHTFVPFVLAAALVAGCDGGTAPATQPPEARATAAAPAPVVTEVGLEDVVETRPDYIIGITYPKSAVGHPELAGVLKAYADAARADLMKAVAGLGGQKPAAPYDLSLQFTGLVDRPHIMAVAADGSSYTGGAHGNPLVARFVWLPQQKRMLTAQALVPDPDNWVAISDASREQLTTRLSQQLDAENLGAAAHAEQLQLGSKAIADGTLPDPGNFAHFEPVVDADGRIRSLRFVFAPSQVGPYVDGTRTVDIPAATLLPLVAAEYRPLFRGG